MSRREPPPTPSDDDSFPPPDSDEDAPPDSDEDDAPPDSDEDDAPPDSDEDDAPPDSEEDESIPPDSNEDDDDDDEAPPDSVEEEIEEKDDDSPPYSDEDDAPPDSDEDDAPPDSDNDAPHDSENDSYQSDDQPNTGNNALVPFKITPQKISLVNKTTKIAGINNGALDFDVGSLTLGLNIKQQPTMRAPQKEVQQVNSQIIPQNDETKIQKSLLPLPKAQILGSANASLSSNQVQVENELLATDSEGFIHIMGMFEGDAFEPLLIKTFGTILLFRVPTGQEVMFDLSTGCSIFKDPSNSKILVLDHKKQIVFLKFFVQEHVSDILESFPRQIILDQPPQWFSVIETVEVTSNKEIQSRKKGQSVEELLEGGSSSSTTISTKASTKKEAFFVDFKHNLDINNPPPPPGPPPADLDDDEELFVPPTPSLNIVAGYKRFELVDDHIKKAKYSVRRVKQLCKWVNKLNIWPNTVEIMNLHSQFCTGILFTKIMKTMVPSANFVQLNERARTQKAAIDNLEQALGFIWRCKSMNTSRIPTAMEIYSGSISKISILLQEIFEVYVARPLYKKAVKILNWYNSILCQYHRPLPNEIFENGDLADTWGYFQDGTALFCIVYHLCGEVTIGTGSSAIQVDPMRIVSEPCSISEFRSNVKYVFALLQALEIEIIWDVDDWISFPDTEFIVLQLNNIFEVLKNRQCSLPPAQGNSAGVTSGPNGKPVVVGLLFSDTITSSKKGVRNKRSSLLLGSGENSLQMLPIDTGGKTGRFYSTVVAAGLVSNDVRIVRTPIDVKLFRETLDERKGWNTNSNTSLNVEVKTSKKEQVLSVLRSQSQKTVSDKQSFEKSKIKSLKSSENAISAKDSEAMSNAIVAQQLADSMEALEKSILQSQKEIEASEEKLTTRYEDLEDMVDKLEPSVYLSLFDELEEERKILEDERFRKQDHFVLRLKSIKQQHQEALNKITKDTEIKLAQEEIIKQSISPTKTTSNKNVNLNKNNDITAVRDKKKAEKGWISVSMKENSSNYHLNQLKLASEAALKNSWSSPRSKSLAKEENKRQKDSNSHNNEDLSTSRLSSSISKLTNKTNILNNEIENSVPVVFQKFKTKLNVFTTKWLKNRHEIGKDRMRDLQVSTTPSRTSASKISLPENNDSIADLSRMMASISEEESRLMLYEDERRKRVLEESSLQQFTSSKSSYNNSNNQIITNVTNNIDHSIGPVNSKTNVISSSSVNKKENFNDLNIIDRPTPSEIDSSFLWLSQPKSFSIADRSKKEYIWIVVKETISNNKTNYILQWKDPNQNKGNSSAEISGFVVINQVDSIAWDVSHDPTLITIVVGESTKALKNSGGRTHVTFNCPSSGECAKYYSALHTLHISQLD